MSLNKEKEMRKVNLITHWWVHYVHAYEGPPRTFPLSLVRPKLFLPRKIKSINYKSDAGIRTCNPWYTCEWNKKKGNEPKRKINSPSVVRPTRGHGGKTVFPRKKNKEKKEKSTRLFTRITISELSPIDWQSICLHSMRRSPSMSLLFSSGHVDGSNLVEMGRLESNSELDFLSHQEWERKIANLQRTNNTQSELI